MPLNSIATEPIAGRATGPANASDALDAKAVLERCLGDAELASMLLRRFEERLPTAINDIQSLLRDGNCAEVLKRAHSLKGEAGSLAAGAVQRAAADLETSLRHSQNPADPQVVRLASALATAAEECRRQMPQFLDSLSAPANTR